MCASCSLQLPDRLAAKATGRARAKKCVQGYGLPVLLTLGAFCTYLVAR